MLILWRDDYIIQRHNYVWEDDKHKLLLEYLFYEMLFTTNHETYWHMKRSYTQIIIRVSILWKDNHTIHKTSPHMGRWYTQFIIGVFILWLFYTNQKTYTIILWEDVMSKLFSECLFYERIIIQTARHIKTWENDIYKILLECSFYER